MTMSIDLEIFLAVIMMILHTSLFCSSQFLDKQLLVRNNNIIVDCQPQDNEVPKLAYLSVDPFNYFCCLPPVGSV